MKCNSLDIQLMMLMAESVFDFISIANVKHTKFSMDVMIIKFLCEIFNEGEATILYFMIMLI